jgi:hypothetical protein
MAGFTVGYIQPEERHGADVLADRQLDLLLQGLAMVVIPVVEDLITQLVADDDGRADMSAED